MIAAGARVSSLDEKRLHCMPMTFDRSPLGNPTEYPERYDPSLLFPIARAGQREAFGLRGPLPFGGVDLWTADQRLLNALGTAAPWVRALSTYPSP